MDGASEEVDKQTRAEVVWSERSRGCAPQCSARSLARQESDVLVSRAPVRGCRPNRTTKEDERKLGLTNKAVLQKNSSTTRPACTNNGYKEGLKN